MTTDLAPPPPGWAPPPTVPRPPIDELPFFCTEAKHPNPANSAPAEMFDLVNRTFYVAPYEAAAGCVTCPACRKQVSAIPLEDPTRLPPNFQVIKDRLDRSSHI